MPNVNDSNGTTKSQKMINIENMEVQIQNHVANEKSGTVDTKFSKNTTNTNNLNDSNDESIDSDNYDNSDGKQNPKAEKDIKVTHDQTEDYRHQEGCNTLRINRLMKADGGNQQFYGGYDKNLSDFSKYMIPWPKYVKWSNIRWEYHSL